MTQLKGSPCRVLPKVKVGADTILDPDAFVICDAAHQRTKQVFAAPTVSVEVLCASTQSYDRGSTLTRYRGMPMI